MDNLLSFLHAAQLLVWLYPGVCGAAWWLLRRYALNLTRLVLHLYKGREKSSAPKIITFTHNRVWLLVNKWFYEQGNLWFDFLNCKCMYILNTVTGDFRFMLEAPTKSTKSGVTQRGTVWLTPTSLHSLGSKRKPRVQYFRWSFTSRPHLATSLITTQALNTTGSTTSP